jgi:hypothetical protein
VRPLSKSSPLGIICRRLGAIALGVMSGPLRELQQAQNQIQNTLKASFFIEAFSFWLFADPLKATARRIFYAILIKVFILPKNFFHLRN